MQFESLTALWEMHGHGPYVWASYALALVVMGGVVWAPWARQKRFFSQQQRHEQQMSRRRQQQAEAASNSSSD